MAETIKEIKEQPSYYSIIPANVRYDKDLKPNEKLLYAEITSLTQKSGICYASNNYFAKLYGVTKETVSGWISSLVKNGYIKREIIYKEGTKEIISRYIRINEYPINEKINTPIKEKLKGNTTRVNTTSNNKESKGAKTFDEIICEYTENLETQNLLKEWLKVRKSKRGAMTNYAIELNLKKMDSLARESGMILNNYLEEVIRRGWVAFYKINNYDNKQKIINAKKPNSRNYTSEEMNNLFDKI